MCDIAPFQMKCENEEYKCNLTVCAVAHLNQALNNVLTEIPILGKFIPEYHCGAFRIKGGNIDEMQRL